MTMADMLGVMLEQQARTLHRNTDPETSRMAAESVVPKLRKLQAEVLAYAQGCGFIGFTDLDLAKHFNNAGSTYRTRRAELVRLGLIEDSSKMRIQKGRAHTIWRCTQEGFNAQT